MEITIEGCKFQPSEGSVRSPALKGFTQEINFSKTIVRLQRAKAEEDRARIKVWRVKEEVSGCKKSVEQLLHWMNIIQLNLNECRKEKSALMRG